MNKNTNYESWPPPGRSQRWAVRAGGLWLLLTLAAVAHAQFGYTTNNGTITITGYAGPGGAVTIPCNINGLPVTTIGDEAFDNYHTTNQFDSALTSVTIPDSVVSIEVQAFYWSLGLTNVTIPNSMTNIGLAAFGQCTNLTTITIPSSVTSIGSSIFQRCSSLATVTIGNGLTTIPPYTFESCTSLTTITIPSSVTSIAEEAFENCAGLARVYFRGNAPSLGPNVFSSDNGATIYYLPGTRGWGATFGGRPTAPYVLPPTIQASPQTQTVEANSAVEFQVTAVGGLLGYQWFFNSTNRLNCTNSILHVASIQYSQAGAYTVVVTNAAGSVTSPPALLSVIAPVERRIVPALKLMGQPGTSLNLDFTTALGLAAHWTTFDHVPLTASSQWYFDLTSLLPRQGFYRAWQSSGGAAPSLSLNFVPALTLTGAVGSSVRLDCINKIGPIDAWVTNLATVTLTNTSQLYFDTSVIGQPPRLWRIVPVP